MTEEEKEEMMTRPTIMGAARTIRQEVRRLRPRIGDILPTGEITEDENQTEEDGGEQTVYQKLDTALNQLDESIQNIDTATTITGEIGCDLCKKEGEDIKKKIKTLRDGIKKAMEE